MTEKRFKIHEQMSTILGYECVFDNQKEEWLSIRDTVLCLIELAEENEQLKQQIKDLYKFVKYDVDNEIDVYPKSMLEHLVNILKIIGDVE